METVNETPLVAVESGDRSDGPLGAFRESRAGWVTLGLVWLASTIYMGLQLRQCWVPSDAGMLAEMADRVLRGQVPYRDFVENYTGGLTYLNALAFRLFGVNFFSLRIPLFLFFLGWVPAVYFIARRFSGITVAGAVTLLSVAWSVPNYPEAMPSWYNLFFATWGVLALLRHSETKKKRWLWVAGLCAGLSFLIKVSGLYFVAAALLYFVFRERSPVGDSVSRPWRGPTLYNVFIAVGLLAFALFLIALVSARPSAMNYANFALPEIILATTALTASWGKTPLNSGARFRRLFSTAWPFVAGACVPAGAFVVWIANQHALAPWLYGTFFSAAIRTHWAGIDMPVISLALFGLLPAALILALAYEDTPRSRRLTRLAAPTVLVLLLIGARHSFGVYIVLGCSAPSVVLALALVLPWVLRRPRNRPSRFAGDRIFLLVSTAVLCSLIQFPTGGAWNIYFCYVAPLVALALAAVMSACPPRQRLGPGLLLAFYLIFALWLRPPGYFAAQRRMPYSSVTFRRLTLARAGGLEVKTGQAEEYGRLVPFLLSHAEGRYTYCTTDCPSVYFLSGLLNPTETIYDFLDPDFLNIAGRDARILMTLSVYNVRAVVITRLEPGNLVNSGLITPALRASLDARYPRSQTIGDFEVRWKP